MGGVGFSLSGSETFRARCGREKHVALVHVRLEHVHAHGARLVEQHGQLVRAVQVVRHHGAEELHRVVRLQIRRLIRHDGVGRRVRFVEAVTGKFFQQVEHLVRLGLGDVIPFLAAFDEGRALALHLLDLLLAHGATQQIRRAQRVAGEQLRGLHDLLLVDEHAVRFLGDRFEQGMRVLDLHAPMPALDEVGNQVHRAGAIERHERGDVLDGTDLKLAAQIPHAA